MIVDFQDPNNPSADIKNISPNDWDKAYDLQNKNVADDIFRGHQVTSPMLFGCKTEGQLGGASEMETAYEIFKNTYVRNKRNELQNAFNMLFTGFGLVKGKVEFLDKALFSAKVSETLKEKIYTINELRKEAGLQPLPNGEKLLTDTVTTTKFSSDVFQLSEEDFEKIKELGIAYNEFEFVNDGEFVKSKEDFNRIELQFELSQEIADYLIENEIGNSTINEIKKALRKDAGINVTSSELKDTLKQLNDAKIINVTIEGNNISVKPLQSADKPQRQIEVMYSYEVRKGQGEPIIDTTRAFCRKLIENNKLYTREEIQTMSSIFGYDIFEYGGGYYRDPSTGTLAPHCRHNFKSNIVIRKK
jgi:hypothetical protein